MASNRTYAKLEELPPFGGRKSSDATERSSLVCIGRNIQIEHGDSSYFLDGLYVAPNGRVAATLPPQSRFYSARISKVLQGWSSEMLDEIAGVYFYNQSSQASRVIDVMARRGYLTFSDDKMLSDALDRCLSSGDFLLLIDCDMEKKTDAIE